jgi:hypothetical protein
MFSKELEIFFGFKNHGRFSLRFPCLPCLCNLKEFFLGVLIVPSQFRRILLPLGGQGIAVGLALAGLNDQGTLFVTGALKDAGYVLV